MQFFLIFFLLFLMTLQCDTDDCVEAHTNVDVIADIDAIQELLEDRLPLIWAGVPVNEAKLPWPPPN